MFTHQFKHAWDASVSQFVEDLPWQMIAFAIAVGSFVMIWIIIYIGDFFLGSPMSKSYQAFRQDHVKYFKKTRRCGRSFGRLFFISLAVVIGAGGLWIACTTAGVSFYNILFGYGVATIILTYSFGSGLQSIGSYFLLSLTNKISEGWYIIFVGMPVEGRVTAINILWVELEYIDPSTGKFRDLFIPTTHIISSIFLRDYKKEEEEPAQLTHETASKMVGMKSAARNRLNIRI